MRINRKPNVVIKATLTVRGIGVAVRKELESLGRPLEAQKAFTLAMNSYGREDCIKKLSKFVTLEEK